MGVSAIVLAGGRSSRFGRDKLVEPLGDGTVLTRTIAAVRAVVSDVVVVAGTDGSPDLPSGVRLAQDRVADGGPLVGVVAGLEAVANEIVVIVGGDMPWLVPEVLSAWWPRLGQGPSPTSRSWSPTVASSNFHSRSAGRRRWQPPGPSPMGASGGSGRSGRC